MMKNKKLINSFKYAIEGIISSLKNERNLKIHFLIMLIVILLGIIFKISLIEWIICVLLFSLVIGAELFNTVIEIIVDMVMPNIDKRAKAAKDISAGAVLVFALGSAIVGFIIFIPKFLLLF